MLCVERLLVDNSFIEEEGGTALMSETHFKDYVII